jgi:hypothetical protein
MPATSQLWIQQMRRGAFEEAWKITDADVKARAGNPCWHLPRHFQYIWDGSSLQGKRVLVRCYHGLGDTIQFIRYAPLLKKMAREVIVWAQAALIPLLKTIEGIDQLLPLHDGTPEVKYDADVEIMELPHIFRTTLDTIPAPIPYLHTTAKPLSTDTKGLAVGLVWQGGDWDSQRNIPFHLLHPLFTVPNVSIYILQAHAKAAGWEEGFGIHSGELSIDACAQAMQTFDLMISVDSMAAHLAGALGVPVWNLLQAEADWRWMKDRDDSPWYPTMRLFRQSQPGDWNGVIERVKMELLKISLSKCNA